ncbi:unnamed protein product [Boreogadus saida]
MAKYKGVITTEDRLLATTWDHVHIKLVGTEGESRRKALSTGHFLFKAGSVLKFELDCKKSIGKLVLIELNKNPRLLLPKDPWFPAKVELKSPEGETFLFPIHRWITNKEVQQFREATACLVFDDIQHCASQSRTKELKLRKEQYCWSIYTEGIPHCMKIDNVHSMPDEVRFSFTKEVEFGLNALQGASLRFCGPADEQLRRGELGASPAAKLRESLSLAPSSPSRSCRRREVGRRRHGVERDCTPGAELLDCHQATPAGAARPPELLVCWSCHLASAPVQLPEYSSGAAGLRPDGFDGSRQLWSGELRGSPAAQLPEYNPFLLHVAVHGLQKVNAKAPSPQFFSTMAEISPTMSLYLWKMIELKLHGLADCKEKWTSIDAIGKVFRHKQTTLSEYVQQNWMKDSLFGYQFLNGVNPMVIRRCSELPENVPVTDQMVFLHGGRSLAEEMQSGNIFLCDYKLLDGLKANKVNGKQQYLMAPLVLLHKTPEDQLMPIAIQLKQEPSKDNPIFFPTDSEYDWLLAKMFVRSADFQEHQLSSHLLRTHLLAEVFSVSLLRNLPMVHPLYKLLVPHTRYTLQINFLARKLLISDSGIFNRFASSGGQAMQTILQRATSSITYTSLCVRDDIKERGLESVPHFYYREDGFHMWDITNRFVQGVLGYYYKDDSDVQRDTELQTWVLDIFEHGFLSRPESGMPQRLNTVAELVKFVTMVIFTGSAQHAAVNSGQFDYGSWMPNTPTTLQRPPPTTKGTADERSLLETLPDVNATVHGMAVMWLLSKQSSDFVPLGHYPEEHFSERVPRQHMEIFKGELGLLSALIEARNLSLEIPCTFLDPPFLENSVAI